MTIDLTPLGEGSVVAPPGESCCPDHVLSRRRLLAVAAAGAGGLVLSTAFDGAFRQVVSAGAPGGNVLVVLSLRGGADGLSIVVPHGDRAYYDRRPGIAVPPDRLIWRDDTFGLHPALSPLLGMWQRGKFAAVHAVGLPAPNRSHFEAMEVVEDADPGSRARTGWINRMIALDATAGPAEGVQLGSSVLPTSLVGAAPALGLSTLADLRLTTYGDSEAATREALATTWGGTGGELGDNLRLALRTTRSLRALRRPIDLSAYPPGPLQEVLANTARLIRADVGTKVVAIDYGNWDMHTDVGTAERGWMWEHLTHLARSLEAFFSQLGSAWRQRVTLVTISEFGRRVAENGDGGLDHGYGNCMLLLGAGVLGGQVHGRWPGLDDLADGDVPVRQDFRDVLAEVIATRFPTTPIGQVFPGHTPRAIGAMSRT